MSKFPNSIFLSIIPDAPGNRENGVYEEWSLVPVDGAENQEYVPALAWEDMAKIDAIILDVNNEFAVDYSKKISRQKFYEEVLKRFNEQRKK